MSVYNSIILNSNEKQQSNIEFNRDLNNLPSSNSEMRETFVTPKVKSSKSGKEREFLKKYFTMRAAQEALEKIIRDLPMPESTYFTEYMDSFCINDSTFHMNDYHMNVKQLAKNPLYNENVKTYYKEQFDKNNLKVDPEVRNEKRPYVRRTLFTTLPELALDEPRDGF